MKRFNWKKILSLVLVLTLVVGTLTWNKRAASADNETVGHNADNSKVWTTTKDEIKITKELKNLKVLSGDDAGFAEADIELTIDGASATITQTISGKTDIVFVMDLSSSMEYGTNGKKTDDKTKQRITAAKAAAVDFAKGILPETIATDEDKNVRIGIASFGKNGHQDFQLSYNRSDVITAIGKLKVGSDENNSNGTGTNLLAGIQAAEEILKKSEAANKIIVILSDGHPTYSYQGTGVNSNETTLPDGSKVTLLSTFNSTLKGGGGAFTFDSYKINNKSYQTTGWYYTSNDKSATTSLKNVTFEGNLTEGTIGTYKSGSKSYEVKYHFGLTDNNGIPAISEAKKTGAIIYSIAYDVEANLNSTDNDTKLEAHQARFVMSNVASSKGKYYAATSGETTDTETAIKDVIKTISTEVGKIVDAAKSTKLVDELPSYMTAVSVSGKDAADAKIDNSGAYGNDVDWNLADLGENTTKKITVKVKINLNEMAKAYAEAHPTQYKNADAVKEALAKGADIWFDMNKQVTLTYTDKDSKPVEDKSLKAVEGKICVPQGQVGTYKYTINYVDEDNNSVGDPVSGYMFLGETVTVSDSKTYTDDTTVYDHTVTPVITVNTNNATVSADRTFAMPAAEVVITVKYTHKLYKITFTDWNGTVIKVSNSDKNDYREYRYNAPVTTPADPKRENDNYKEYTFDKWTPAVTNATEDKTYKATYTSEDRLYTIVFQNENGGEIDSIPNLKYDQTYDVPNAPKKDSSDTQDFAFAGWVRQGGKAPKLGTCDGDAIYKASYEPTTRHYTVYFYNVLLDEKGNPYNELYDTQTSYEFEQDIEAPATDPSRPANNTYRYTFKGWTPELGKVTTDEMKFYAEYTPVQIPYIVSFKYDSGEQTNTYKYDATVTPPSDETVAKRADKTYTYRFEGWAEEREGVAEYTVDDVNNTTVITSATKSVTYVAVYTPIYIKYTIKFVNGNTVLQGENKEYHWDDTVKYEGAIPTKLSSETYAYFFTEWSPKYTDNMAVSSITFDESNTAIFTAQFDNRYIDYKIEFRDSDGTPILVSKAEGEDAKAVNLYHYGDTVVKPADPTIADSDEWDNYFAGWSPAVTTVTQDQVYTATYGKKKQKYNVTFKQYDGYTNDTGKTDIIFSEDLDYGTPIVAPTEGIVVKPADETYTYAFNNVWTPTLSDDDTVVGDVIYVAVMDPTYIDYTIKFVNGDTVLQGEDTTYHWDQTVKYVGGTPVKSDKTYKYTFSGWKNKNAADNKYSDDMKVSDVVFDDSNEAIFEAQFTTTEIPYTVKFVVVDGGKETVISEQTGRYEHAVTIPETPEKDELRDDNDVLIETYDFDGWYLDDKLVENKDIVKTATENLTYYGKFTPVRAEYTVKFVVVDVDGKKTTVSEENYKYGDPISLPKVGTEKEENVDVISVKTVNGIVYQVTPWSPEPIMNCNGNATYECKYIVKPDVLYAVTFKFENGEADDVKSYTYGAEIEIPDDPKKEADETYTYKFSKWTPVFPVNDQKKAICVGKAIYTAQYEPTFIEYEIRFIDDDGKTPILVNGKEVNTYHYNVAVDQPVDPKKDADETYTYTFAGWVNTAVSGAAVMSVPACTENVTYQATYEPHYINYTVVFENEGKEVSRLGDYHYGDTIVVAPNQTKDHDEMYDYTFIGWAVKSENEAVSYAAADVVINPLNGENDPEVKVTKSITYVAVYEPSYRIFKVEFVDDDGTALGDGFESDVVYGNNVTDENCEAATNAAEGVAILRAHDKVEYFFNGWMIKNSEGNLVPVIPTTVKIVDDTTFYASYREKNDYDIFYHGSDASLYGTENEKMYTVDSIKEGKPYDVIKDGPELADTHTTTFKFIGWSLEPVTPEVFPDYNEKQQREDIRFFIKSIKRFAGVDDEDSIDVNGCIVRLSSVSIKEIGGEAKKIDLYPVYIPEEIKYYVIFKDADGTVLASRNDFIYNEPALDLKPADPKGWVSVSGYTTTTYTFKNWSVSDAELAAVTKNMVVTAQYDVKSVSNPPVIIITPTPSPTPSPTPTVTPTPVEEEIIETPETPQGPVEEPEEEIIPPQPETPQGAPEEEVDLDDVETPQGDLPKTGTTPTAVFFGLGAACIMLGGVMLKSVRRREDEM